MTQITIQAGGFPNYYGPSTGEIWIVANRPFTTPQGTPISASYVPEATFLTKVGYTVDGSHVLQVPEIVIDATEDSIDYPDATLGAYVMTSQGRPVTVLAVFRQFKVPAAPVTTSWGQLAAHNGGIPLAPPATPSAPVATAINSGQVDVVISAAAGAASYKLFRSANGGGFSQIASGIPSGTYHDTGVSPVTDYQYKVEGSNLGGDSAQSTASNTATTPQVAAPPTSTLSGSSIGADVHLTTTTTARVTIYQVWRNKNAGGYSLLQAVSVVVGAAMDFHDDDVEDGDSVFYKVKASNAGGDSVFSNEVSITVSETDIFTPVDPVHLSPTSQNHYELRPEEIINSADSYPLTGGQGDATPNAWGHGTTAHTTVQAPFYNLHGGASGKKYICWDDVLNSRFDISQVGAESLLNIRDLVMTFRPRTGGETLAAWLTHILGSPSYAAPSEVWVDCVLTNPTTFSPTAGISYTIGCRWSSDFNFTFIGGTSKQFDIYRISAFTNGGSPIADLDFHGVNQFLRNLYHTPKSVPNFTPNTGASTKQILILGDSHSSALHPVFQSGIAAQYPTASIELHAYGGTSVDLEKFFEEVLPLLDHTKEIVASLWTATNDLGNASPSGDGHVIYYRIREYVYWLRRYGIIPVVTNSMKRGDAGLPGDFEAQRTAFNSDLAAGASTYGYNVVDVASRAHLSDPNDTTYFNSDKAHLQDATYGSDIFPPLFAVIDSL